MFSKDSLDMVSALIIELIRLVSNSKVAGSAHMVRKAELKLGGEGRRKVLYVLTQLPESF